MRRSRINAAEKARLRFANITINSSKRAANCYKMFDRYLSL